MSDAMKYKEKIKFQRLAFTNLRFAYSLDVVAERNTEPENIKVSTNSTKTTQCIKWR